MKVLIVGSGGREHALALTLKRQHKDLQLFCIGKNAGISELATMVDIPLTEHQKIVAYAQAERITFAIIGPDAPLVEGLADRFSQANIGCFGPSKKASRIEGSKAYAKAFMKRHNIPSAGYEVFDDYQKALNYLKKCSYPLVLKADGLAFGKGVVIAQNIEEAELALQQMLVDQVFGASGTTVVIEEYVTGEEVSLLVFTDGVHARPAVSAMDHKRSDDGDVGLNTGGMGVIAPNPFYDERAEAFCMQHIVEPTIRGLREEGNPFTGCLFFGLMLTQSGPLVIEYNCRFGDPEAEAVLSLLESDLLEILVASAEGRLDQVKVSFSKAFACSVALASGGYPSQYEVGKPITIGPLSEGITVLHAATAYDGQHRLCTDGGRVLHVVGRGKTLRCAIELAYAGVSCISFERMMFRSDIGLKACKEDS